MNKDKLSWYKLVLLLIGIALCCGLGVHAQEVLIPPSEVSFYVKAPYSKVSYDLGDAGENRNRFGVGVGVQYAHYFNIHWSVSGGVEFQTYRSQAVMGAFSDSYPTTDIEGDNFDFQYQISSYQERQNLALINIPIRVQYDEMLSENFTFYGSAGVSVGFPVAGKYKARAFGLNTAGYYEQWDALLTSPKFMGFGTWGNQQIGKQDLDPKASFALLLETGLKHKIAVGHSLYFGLFVDIPLNDINKSGNNSVPLVEYDPYNPTKFIYNSVIEAAPGAEGAKYADKINAFAFGVKLRYAFDF